MASDRSCVKALICQPAPHPLHKILINRRRAFLPAIFYPGAKPAGSFVAHRTPDVMSRIHSPALAWRRRPRRRRPTTSRGVVQVRQHLAAPPRCGLLQLTNARSVRKHPGTYCWHSCRIKFRQREKHVVRTEELICE
jgi:hypothetical protein